VERDFSRDLDIAVWLKNPDKAFYYVVDFSAKLEIEMGFPIDLQVFNKASLPFQFYVSTWGNLLFSRDESLTVMMVDDVVRKYGDLKFLVKMNSLGE